MNWYQVGKLFSGKLMESLKESGDWQLMVYLVVYRNVGLSTNNDLVPLIQHEVCPVCVEKLFAKCMD